MLKLNSFSKKKKSSPQANDYKRSAKIGSSLQGGIGGSSLRLPAGFTGGYSRSVPLKDFKRADLILCEKVFFF